MRLANLVPVPWQQDLIAMALSFLVALSFLKFNDLIVVRGWLPEYITRKLVHIGTGPLFLLCWPFYSEAWHARWFAALVPASLTAVFALIGLGILKKDDFVAAMSRSGDPRELLRGPLMYGIVFVVATLVFWRTSPVGVILLMLLCGGDGLADVIGRRYGAVKLPGQQNRSWAGSIGFFLGGAVLALLFLKFFTGLGFLNLDAGSVILPLLVTSLLATLVEGYSPADLDNLTVPVSALLALWLMISVLGWWPTSFLG